jgi:hypothetical protein
MKTIQFFEFSENGVKHIINIESVAHIKFWNDFQCDIYMIDGTVFCGISLKYEYFKAFCGQ